MSDISSSVSLSSDWSISKSENSLPDSSFRLVPMAILSIKYLSPERNLTVNSLFQPTDVCFWCYYEVWLVLKTSHEGIPPGEGGEMTHLIKQ